MKIYYETQIRNAIEVSGAGLQAYLQAHAARLRGKPKTIYVWAHNPEASQLLSKRLAGTLCL